MNRDISLLDELSAARSDDSGNLIAALHAHRRRRRTQIRALAASALTIALIAGALHFQPQEKPALAVTDPPRSTILTKNQLLDSFGDQPVALVTWPDGRQQLLAIPQRPVR